jgi:hypothetical protein
LPAVTRDFYEACCIDDVSKGVTANIGSPLESALCWFLQEFVKQICWAFWWFWKKQHKADSKGDPILAATEGQNHIFFALVNIRRFVHCVGK